MDDFPRAEVGQLIEAALDHLGDPGVVGPLNALRERWLAWNPAQRRAFYALLARLEIPQWPAAKVDLDDPAAVKKLTAARDACESPRRQLLEQFVNLPGGIKFLVDLRADLRAGDRSSRGADPDPALSLLEQDLLALLRSWFNFGFLTLAPIGWDRTPAAQLERIMAQDTVHPMASWDDLRRRLDRDRLCYAFYHPNMPDEPIVFVEIALTRTIASSIDRLFTGPSVEKPDDATTAIFYSINATQPGLAGVSLGNMLIKTVVAELQRRLPNLKRFSTLSPMPGFRDRFIAPLLAGKPAAKSQLQRDDLAQFFDKPDAATLTAAAAAPDLPTALAHLLATDAWASDPALRLALKPGLLRLAHHYLVNEKRGGEPVNPVASFHLKNGACLYNLNYLSNTAPKGMAESFGLTVNYHYDLKQIDANREAARRGEVKTSPQLEKMLKLGVSA